MIWDFGDGSDILEINSENEATTEIIHKYITPGSFTVSLRFYNTLGCFKEITKQIGIGKGFLVVFPSAFTPNGDPLNSHFGLSGITQGVSQFKMMIYNRWGQQVFYSEDVNIKWDGTFLGKPAEQGVYVYRMEYTNPKQTQWYYFNGEVNLLR